MNEAEMNKQILEGDKKTSLGLGVPKKFFADELEFISWRGKFKAIINDRSFEMVVTPSTLFINEPDPQAPILHKMGGGWEETKIGKLYCASYISSQINGGFQIFRTEYGEPFAGFEKKQHSHMLVYTDGSNEKTYIPVKIEFSND
jgi:hypothetical protein